MAERIETSGEVSIDEAVSVILAKRERAVETVLIDGPSGAGKSTLTDALVAAWPDAVSLVRMDNIYPGWGGLLDGSELVHTHLIGPRSRGADARWQRHDWVGDTAAEWHAVPSDRSLILEGCGALSRANAPLATLRVWLDADDAIRKRRALARDRGAFDVHWDEWDRQFARFVDTEHPAATADIVLRLS